MTDSEHTYLVCRALDTDPRSRARATVLTRDLQAVLAGLSAVAQTAGATKGYLCVDAAEPEQAAAVEAAVAAAAAAQTGAGLDISVVPVAASLMLEDDSALLRVLEGRQAIPHVSVPPSAQPLLSGRPAVVYDVGELMRLAPGAPTTRTLAVWAGDDPRVVEAPRGATLRAVLRDVAGIDPETGGATAVRFGGALGRFVTGSGLDAPIGAEKAWFPGVIEIVPAGVCGVGCVGDALRSLSAESCGACIACREGTRQIADMLADLAESRAGEESWDLLQELAGALQAGSICGLGRSAADVLRTGLEAFAEDFRAHLAGARCPEAQAHA